MGKSPDVCWELYRCRDRSCPVYGDRIVGSPERMRVATEDIEAWRSGLFGQVEALSCGYFKRLRDRGRGRRAVDRNLDIFLERALRRLAGYNRRLALIDSSVPPKLDELNLLGQFSQLVPTLETVDEVCFALLTVITAGQGLGFNRAMLFWREQGQSRIFGRCAIGPRDHQDAARIWNELAEQEPWLDLREMVHRCLRSGEALDSPLARWVREIGFNVEEEKEEFQFARSTHDLLELHGDTLTHPIDVRLARQLDLQHFVSLPLAHNDRSLGFLLVDNRFSGASLPPEQVDLVQVLTRFASSLLQNLLLQASLEVSLTRSEATREVLREIRLRVARAEQLAMSGEMSAAMAHEIRNPLTAIGGFSRRLLRSENLSEADRRTVAVIVEESGRLEEFLGKLMHSAQREELRFRAVDLNEALLDIIALLKDRIAEAGIELVSDFDPDIDRVLLNSGGFRQVMLNLLRNAIEAIAEEGEIRIHTEQEGDWILVQVSDSGVGMEAEQIRQAFRAFYTTKHGGTGLGLAISQRIVRKHGGELSVESKSGEGTCFSVRLPSYVKGKSRSAAAEGGRNDA
jgi:signal transduction histidine kinase